MNLFIVTVFYWGEPFIYAVAAENQEAATQRAVSLIKVEMEVEASDIEIDSELTFEVSCASDIRGQLYYVDLREAADH